MERITRMNNDNTKIIRFTVKERLLHWGVALSFLYAALTGLALWSPRLYWLSYVFGGGVTVRACLLYTSDAADE